METFRLKSSIEFGYSLKDKTDYEYRQLRDSYDSFLKQPLKLEMFVPCDKDGNVLGEPYNDGNGDNYFGVLLDEYQQAKEKVLFEGFEKAKNVNFDFKRGYSLFKISYYKNIEHFLNDVPDITLTPNAIKQLGL